MMFGVRHVELTALKAIGTWTEDSGWTGALVKSGIASSGTADSFLKASPVSKTRRAHQITASVLTILMLTAYKSYCNVVEEPREIMSYKVPFFQTRMTECCSWVLNFQL